MTRSGRAEEKAEMTRNPNPHETGEPARSTWSPPPIDVENIPTGDMPGDRIQINTFHLEKASAIFPHLLDELPKVDGERKVISVYGGSGVGKSEIASLLGEYCRHLGLPSYVLSGDNYALRIPESNDRERLSVYRNGALTAFARHESFTNARMARLRQMWQSLDDMNPASHPSDDAGWLDIYHQAGHRALARYLGTEREIDFSMVNAVIESFKAGSQDLNLKRMGRTIDDLWYEAVNFADTRVLIIEWTHGNNPRLEGIDYAIFLFSTPAETLAHRLARGRDSNADSPLISLVLEIEQETLMSQADHASLIISKSGDVLSPTEFRQRLAER